MVSLRSLVAGAALIAAPVMAALTPTQLTSGLDSLKKLALALQEPASQITIVSAPLIIIGQGPFPAVIMGITQMVSTGTVLISESRGTPAIAGEDADLVYSSFAGFAKTTQDFLNIMIGKAGILTKVPFIGQPVAASLRQLEGVVDTITIFVIDTVKTKAEDLTATANSLGDSLDLCIKQYEGLQMKKRAEVFVA
ncbi:hypothetical protein C8A05DRAFT_20386 [Staphylotrichum tortipilum]|uniref:Uncharacterized protein n=1 Tax=Staphylotrichum tortipilum TaxID=2831512 RepID=A0AAN6MB27_9PEZI|nr:hypothetical protein C8A05DRAFT_20386 [Staphylotrichum longicolle]